MAVRFAPGVGDCAAAFAALAEAILHAVTVIGRDGEGMPLARQAAVDRSDASDKTDDYRQGRGPIGRNGALRARDLEVRKAMEPFGK